MVVLLELEEVFLRLCFPRWWSTLLEGKYPRDAQREAPLK